jgi:tetratricopeptide (TPR) repeat protein
MRTLKPASAPTRRLLLVVLLALSLTRPAFADWSVKRDGGRALRDQALRALLVRPDNAGLAAQAVRGAGPQEVARLLDRLAGPALAQGAPYSAVLAHAQLLLAAGRPGEAGAAFGRAAALAPEAAAPRLGQAQALEREGQLAPALLGYQAALARERSPGRRRPILQATAALAMRTGAAAAEIEARRLLAAERPGDVALALALASALGRGGRAREGAAAVEQLMARAPRGSARRMLLAREAAHLREAAGDPEAAERLLREALESQAAPDGERLELYRQVVRLALRRGRGNQLEPWLSKQAGPGAGRARTAASQALAELREELGDYEGAVRSWRELHRRDPGSVLATRKLVALLDRLGRDDEVARLYETSMKAAAVDTETILDMIERKYRRGERADGQRRFDQALRRLKRSPRALVRLADLASRWNEGERVLACWDSLYALDPRDERAIVGLGEAHFQAGRRELARRTWHGLLRVVRPPAAANARLAELLGDHDLLDEALPLARTAQKLEPTEPGHHRTLARILEKKRELSAAVSEWRAVLQKSARPERTPERREARARIVNLLAREGRERLRAETVLLKDRLGRHPEDRESALFLAELQLRLQSPADAVQTLSTACQSSPGDAELVLMLVRLLRQSRQSDRAVTWLERFADSVPARAPEALLQIAEIRLERYEDKEALAAADRAVELSRRAPEVLVRAAELQDRAGQPDRALASYRAALDEPASPKAALAAADLLVRRGQASEALDVLRTAGRSTSDPEARADLMARELDLAEYAQQLPDLMERLAARPSTSTAAERRLVVELYRRILPALYRSAARDAEARARWQQLAEAASRPLVAVLLDPEGEPDPAIIELAGMLENRDVLPLLLRLAAPVSEAGADPRPDLPEPPANSAQADRVMLAAVVALGRLKATPALPRLIELSSTGEVKLRAAAVWALGRLEAAEAEPRLRAATRDPRAEVAALAALGLGHLRGPELSTLLRSMALDAAAPVDARRAALLALARSGMTDPEGALLPLLDAPEPSLARTAAFALGVMRDRSSLSGLWRRALLGAGETQKAARLALATFASDAAVPDDAPAVRGSRLEASELLDELCAFPPDADGQLEALWTEYATDIAELLVGALRGRTEDRRRALGALDGRGGGLGLGRLAGPGPQLSSRAERALGEIAGRVRGPIVELLSDPDLLVRLRALRLATKLRDSRVTNTHIVAALRASGDRGQADGAGTEGLDPAQVGLEALSELRARGQLDAHGLWQQTAPLLGDPAWVVRLAAVEAMYIPGTPPASMLKPALEDVSPLVRAAASRSARPDRPTPTPTAPPAGP